MEKPIDFTDFLDQDFSFLMKVFEGWWNEDSDRLPSWSIINSGISSLLIDLHIVPHVASNNTLAMIIAGCHCSKGQVTTFSKTLAEPAKSQKSARKAFEVGLLFSWWPVVNYWLLNSHMFLAFKINHLFVYHRIFASFNHSFVFMVNLFLYHRPFVQLQIIAYKELVIVAAYTMGLTTSCCVTA